MKEKPITNISDKEIGRIGKMTSYPNILREGAIPKSLKSSFMQMVAPRTFALVQFFTKYNYNLA
jgi:hypothetical protein